MQSDSHRLGLRRSGSGFLALAKGSFQRQSHDDGEPGFGGGTVRVLSPLLKRVVYPSLGKTGYLRRHRASFVSVVTYHGVLPDGYESKDQFLDSSLVSLENFHAQLRLLKSDYDVISCTEFKNWLDSKEELSARAVLITCDDGLLNNLTHMLPLLRGENLDCLFFVTAASAGNERATIWYLELYLMLMRSTRKELNFAFQGIDVRRALSDPRSRHLAWLDLVKKLSGLGADARRAFLDEAATQCCLQPDWKLEYFQEPLRKRFALLTKTELQELADAGMTIGAHSVSHAILTEQNAQSAETEIADSRKALLATGHSVWAFAYPFGDTTTVGDRELKLAQKAGFQCAFMNTGGCMSASSPPYALPRIHITSDMRLREFEAHVTGFHSALRSRFA